MRSRCVSSLSPPSAERGAKRYVRSWKVFEPADQTTLRVRELANQRCNPYVRFQGFVSNVGEPLFGDGDRDLRGRD